LRCVHQFDTVGSYRRLGRRPAPLFSVLVGYETFAGPDPPEVEGEPV